MKRTSVALLAALEAVIVAAVGLGICLVPFTILWAAQYRLGADFLVVWRSTADVWLVGHGVNLTVTLDEQTVATLGLPGAATPFQVTIALLGFAVLTAGLGVRTGLRASESAHPVAGVLGALVAFLAVSTLVTLTAGSMLVTPSTWQGVLLPPFVYAIGIAAGFAFAALRSPGRAPGTALPSAPGGRVGLAAPYRSAADTNTDTNTDANTDANAAEIADAIAADPSGTRTAARSDADYSDAEHSDADYPGADDLGADHPAELGTVRSGGSTATASTPLLTALRSRTLVIPAAVRDGAVGALRAGSAATAVVIGLAALVLALLIFGNYGAIISLYEQLQTGVAGGIALTVGQLAFLPNLVIWMASWLIGPGFAIGTGSSVSPIGTALGPMPGLPLFGVIPAHGYSFGLVGIVVPLLAGFLAGALLRGTRRASADGPLALFLTALGIGIVAGIELGLLAWWSSGALGPGRLHDVGPNPWLVGSIAAAEIAVAAVIGLMAGGRARR